MLNEPSSNWIDFEEDTTFKFTENMIFTSPMRTTNGSSINIIRNTRK
jgi:hypothetical protein